MTEFSTLVQKQAGRMTLSAILAFNAVAVGAAYLYYDYTEDQNFVTYLKEKAAHMQSEKLAMTKMRQYFDDEASRIEKFHQSNVELMAKAKTDGASEWLSALPGTPTLDELTVEEATAYDQSRFLLARQRAGSELVWSALTHPEDIDTLKTGLTRDNLEVFATVKDCAARGSGEGAYCGASAAFNVRLKNTLNMTTKLQEESEAFSRQNLGLGWDDWDTAQTNLIEAAFKDIDSARAKAQVAFDKGEIDQDEWDSMSHGFIAAKAEASTLVQQDRSDLQARTHSGHLSGYDWYLMSRWTMSSPTQSVTHVVSHPYAAGGSAFVAPSSAFRSASVAGIASRSSAPNAGVGAGLSKTPVFSAPSAINPYSVEAGSSRFGSKVNASFARAAGPKISMAMNASGTSKSGMTSRVSSFSASRGAARAGSISSAGVGHSSGGHGGMSSGS